MIRERRDSDDMKRDLRAVQYSCESFDNAIDQIEEARKINSALREIASEAIHAFTLLESDYADREDDIRRLREQVKKLENEIIDLGYELREACEAKGSIL